MKSLFCLAALSIALLGCTPPQSGTIPPPNSDTQVVLQNEDDNYEVIQEFDLDNCDGKADATRTEHRSSSIDVTVSTELAARIGASVQAISADVQAAVGTALSIGGERGTSIQLNAPPNTHMFFQLAWVGKSRIGVVQNISGSNIPIAFQSFTPDNVRIKSQYDIGCPATPIPDTDQPTTQPTITTVATVIPETQFCPPIGSSDAVFEGDITVFGDLIPSSVGTGVFTNVVRPFGTIPSQYTYVREALNQLCVQIISPGSLIDGASDRQCAVSNYTTNRLWIGTVLAGTSVSVRKSSSVEFMEIGRVDVPVPDARSYVIEYDLAVGDEICLIAPTGRTVGEMFDRGGYQVFWGRDLRVFTDSWCMLLENDGTQHYCN